MSNTLKILIVAALAIAAYWFSLRPGAPYPLRLSGPARRDRYAALRENIGPWSDAADDDGIWVVVGQDFFPGEGAQHPEYNATARATLAFFKAHNLAPDAWTLRSALLDDVSAWIEQEGFITPQEVITGERA